MMQIKLNKNQKIYIIMAIIVFILAMIFFNSPSKWLGSKTITIENENTVVKNDVKNNEEEKKEEEEEAKNRSLINGVECENSKARPFAVMQSGDWEAWPLSGISQADLVIEMPVVTNGITRYMALYNCFEPAEIGSIRSSRHDFIPLAMGFDAIYAHWGGSHYALEKLDNNIMDNIDALALDGSVFFRKSALPKPHNGFTTIEKLREYSEHMGYRTESEFAGYSFYDQENPIDKNGKLSIGYPSSYQVSYNYDFEKNLYFRSRGRNIDKDKLTLQQISAKNVVIMFAASRQIEGQYNDMDIEGEGEAIIYQNGWETKGKWRKDKKNMKSKLFFLGGDGEEIKFVPGKIWIQVVQTNQTVNWELEK